MVTTRQLILKTFFIAFAVILLLSAITYVAKTRRPDEWKQYHVLMSAIDEGNTDLVRRLLRNGVAPNRYPAPNEREDDQAPINLAVQTGNTEIVKLLLDAGANVQTTDPWGGPPLAEAANSGDMNMIRLLVSRHAFINDDDGFSSALHNAAMSGQWPVVRYLLVHGANPWSVDLDVPEDGSSSEIRGQIAHMLKEERRKWPSISVRNH